jgi:hypothetical protein
VATNAAIAGTKIAPDFGSQNVVTTGTISGSALVPTGTTAPTTGIYQPSAGLLSLATAGVSRFELAANGACYFKGSSGDFVWEPSGAGFGFTNNGANYISANGGSNAFFVWETGGFNERFRIAPNGAWGLAGANYGTSGQLLTSNGSGAAPTWQSAVLRQKSITIENPSASEKISLFFTTDAVTVSSIRSVIIGSTSVTFSIRYGTDLSGAGTEVVTGGTVANTTSTIQSTTSFNSASIPADRLVWLTTSALSGTPTQLHVTVVF